MGKSYRIRVWGKQRKRPDAALVAQAIIQLGRELWEKERAEQTGTENPATPKQDKTASSPDAEAQP